MKPVISIPQSELSKLNRDLKRYGKHKDKEIQTELLKFVVDVQEDAKTLVPQRSSVLSGSIRIEKQNIAKLEAGVSAGGTRKAGYAPYVLYGTGSRVFTGGYRFSAEDKKNARQFKGKKKIIGQSSQPFLLLAFNVHFPGLSKRITKLLSKK